MAQKCTMRKDYEPAKPLVEFESETETSRSALVIGFRCGIAQRSEQQDRRQVAVGDRPRLDTPILMSYASGKGFVH
jgi:hypothetical protein